MSSTLRGHCRFPENLAARYLSGSDSLYNNGLCRFCLLNSRNCLESASKVSNFRLEDSLDSKLQNPNCLSGWWKRAFSIRLNSDFPSVWIQITHPSHVNKFCRRYATRSGAYLRRGLKIATIKSVHSGASPPNAQLNSRSFSAKNSFKIQISRLCAMLANRPAWAKPEAIHWLSALIMRRSVVNKEIEDGNFSTQSVSEFPRCWIPPSSC